MLLVFHVSRLQDLSFILRDFALIIPILHLRLLQIEFITYANPLNACYKEVVLRTFFVKYCLDSTNLSLMEQILNVPRFLVQCGASV